MCMCAPLHIYLLYDCGFFFLFVCPVAGVRLGKLMAKLGIVKLLAAYRFEPVSDAELEFENYGITLHVRGGIPMRIAHR